MLYRLVPLSERGVTRGNFTGAGTRHVLWGSGEKDDSLAWVGCPNLLVEFERFLAGVPANVEHDEIVDLRLPQKARGRDLFGFVHLDCVTSQDGGAHLARCLKAVDEENSFVRKSLAVTKWWAIHRTPRNGRALLGRAIQTKSAPRAGESQYKYKKAPMASRGFWVFRKSLLAVGAHVLV